MNKKPIGETRFRSFLSHRFSLRSFEDGGYGLHIDFVSRICLREREAVAKDFEIHRSRKFIKLSHACSYSQL